MNDNNISRKKRKSFNIEVPNKEITFCDTKRFSKYKINDINSSNLSKKLKLKNNSEDYYDSPVYNKSIHIDKIFFGNKYFEKKHYLIKSSSELFYQNKKLINNSRIIRDFYNKRLKMNAKLNLSFENKNCNLILDNEKSLINKSENDNNLRKILYLFALVNKKIKNKMQKVKKERKYLNLYSNNLNINYKNISSKFSRKNKKNSTTNNTNKIYQNHQENKAELYNFSENGNLKNKILKLNKHNITNLSSQENKNNNNSMKKINFKNYDSFIMSSDFNDVFERGRKLLLKGTNLYRSMRKININLNDSGIDKNILLNKSKIKNHSINYSNPRKIKNETRIKTIINEYMNREKDKNNNIIYKSKKNDDDFGTQKIIKKRIILEEEYMINSEGDQKLLSIRKLEDENNNEENNINSNNSLSTRNLKEKSINNENSSNKKYKLNKDNSRKTTYNNKPGIQSIDVDNQIKNMLNNNKIRKTSNKKSKNIKENHPLVTKKSNKIKKIENKLPVKKDLNKKPNKEKKLKKESNNKERSLNKKLFYNRIYINKFNKSNNHSKINFHHNYINSNQTSINYLDDKEKSKLDISKSIYNNISFTKKQPFMIYHNDEKNQNFFINNNQNCSNMVNIVFLNNEKNKINKELERPKAVCDLKKNHYKFVDIKSSFGDDNISEMKSTRNQHNKNIMNATSFEVPFLKNKNNNYSIYSSIDNMNDKRTKNLSILEYLASKPKQGINDISSKYINKSSLNKKDFPKYFFDY